MACFIVPATEAVVTTVATKVMEKDTISHKLKWLNKMLWGGSILLGFEHLWHGEITPWFPFLTAAVNPEERLTMFHEMATTGVMMSACTTAVWAGMVIVSSVLKKRTVREEAV